MADLPDPDAGSATRREALLAAARAARERAYAPYSKFAVGAAVLDEHGRIHAGCNVENAAYPEGWCAETTAIAHMVMDGETRIVEVVVMGRGEALVTPCGGCRQRLREFAGDDVEIHICSPEGLRETVTLGALLPLSFGPGNLE